MIIAASIRVPAMGDDLAARGLTLLMLHPLRDGGFLAIIATGEQHFDSEMAFTTLSPWKPYAFRQVIA